MSAKKPKKAQDAKSKVAIVAFCAAIMISGGLVARAVKPPENGAAIEQTAQNAATIIEPAAGE